MQRLPPPWALQRKVRPCADLKQYSTSHCLEPHEPFDEGEVPPQALTRPAVPRRWSSCRVLVVEVCPAAEALRFGEEASTWASQSAVPTLAGAEQP
mmetsp:Transcript_1198/g.1868  ORF Transcript_1198/g.1868 Transcript_1198/m.1868 type:complete len:96 (+) Transcript_1198:176-463(+)